MSFKIGQVEIGLDKPFFVVAGPCVIEDECTCSDTATTLVEISKRTDVPIIFKASYDKANRSSIESFRGPGLYKGLNILKRVRDHSGLPVITDVHEPFQAEVASRFVDALQVPAFLCRQTDLLVACAKTGLPVNVKKGQFMAPLQMIDVIEKITTQSNNKIILTERGTFFGYNWLVNDMTAIQRMKELHYPVVFDATHSIQRPGSVLNPSNYLHKLDAITLAKAGVAAGANGLYLEVHPNPKESKSDSYTIMPIGWVEDLLVICKEIFRIVREGE